MEGDKREEARSYKEDILSYKWNFGRAEDVKHPGIEQSSPLMLDGRF